MKRIKKIVAVLTVSMAVTSVFSCAYANEISAQPLNNPVVKIVGASQKTSTSPIVSVDNSYAELYSGNNISGIYSYQITSSDTYYIYYADQAPIPNSNSVSKTVNISTKSPTVELSQIYRDGKCYLVIKAFDDGNIKKVTVNGSSISFSESGETKYYEVTRSGKYTVVVTDDAGNETSQSIYIIVGPSTNVMQTVKQTVKFKVNSKSWAKDDITQEAMDTPPLNKNARIYLPIRYAAYALGIDSGKIAWDAKTQSAIIYDGSDVIKVKVGSKIMTVNGQSVTMEAAALSQNGRVLLPISQVSKAFTSKGVSLSWNNITKEITIVRTK